jgi:hypothetical protein
MRFCPCSVFCLEPAVRERLELAGSVRSSPRQEVDFRCAGQGQLIGKVRELAVPATKSRWSASGLPKSAHG